MANYYN